MAISLSDPEGFRQVYEANAALGLDGQDGPLNTLRRDRGYLYWYRDGGSYLLWNDEDEDGASRPFPYEDLLPLPGFSEGKPPAMHHERARVLPWLEEASTLSERSGKVTAAIRDIYADLATGGRIRFEAGAAIVVQLNEIVERLREYFASVDRELRHTRAVLVPLFETAFLPDDLTGFELLLARGAVLRGRGVWDVVRGGASAERVAALLDSFEKELPDLPPGLAATASHGVRSSLLRTATDRRAALELDYRREALEALLIYVRVGESPPPDRVAADHAAAVKADQVRREQRLRLRRAALAIEAGNDPDPDTLNDFLAWYEGETGVTRTTARSDLEAAGLLPGSKKGRPYPKELLRNLVAELVNRFGTKHDTAREEDRLYIDF